MLAGSAATYALDYQVGERWPTASETGGIKDTADAGQIITFVALFNDIPGADTVTLQQPEAFEHIPWRLTDIPIE